MLYFSLPLALVVLVVAHTAARPRPHPIRWGRFFGIGGGAVVAPLFLLGSSPVVAGLFLLLVPALVVWPLVRQRVPTFLPLSITAALIAYGTAGLYALKEQDESDRLRQQYPVESMADRIPAPTGAHRSLPTGAVGHLDRFEQEVRSAAGFPLRTYQLRSLHENTTAAFVNSPGFGVMRMIPGPTAESLKDRSDRLPTPGQPGSPVLWGSEPFEPLADRDALYGMHAGGLLDFVNLQGWGYVKDRDRVAGFLSHRFSKVPEAKTWEVQRVELVGLLKHPEPRVYLSDKLPAMADLQNAPTRPLDVFEATGLEAVRKGEEGFAARRADVVRFVGGIRSAKQCVECHGGERGDLLGAFSYTLRAKAP